MFGYALAAGKYDGSVKRMTGEEKEKYKSILREINKELPKPIDYYDERGGVVACKSPSKEAFAIADIAGILYKVLDMLEREKNDAV